MIRRALYPGTFDPITFGHLDVIHRAAGLFDELIIAVSASNAKSPFFSQSERIQLIEEAVNLKNCQVLGFDGLLVEFMPEVDACVVIRGVRGAMDFEYEVQLDTMNKTLDPTFETLYLSAKVQHRAISASLVKEIASLKGNIDAFVPKNVVDALFKKGI